MRASIASHAKINGIVQFCIHESMNFGDPQRFADLTQANVEKHCGEYFARRIDWQRKTFSFPVEWCEQFNRVQPRDDRQHWGYPLGHALLEAGFVGNAVYGKRPEDDGRILVWFWHY